MPYVKEHIIKLVDELLFDDKEYNVYVAKKMNVDCKDIMTQIIIYNVKE